VGKQLVIIPTYNEIDNIEQMLDEVVQLEANFDVLIVDDNSPDGTAEVVKRKMATHDNRIFLLERRKKQGLGTAYIAGFKWGLEKNYDFLLEMDCDFSHNPADLPRLLEKCKNTDVVVGSRYVNNLVNVVNWPMGRVLLSYFASYYVRLITGMKIMDTTAGFVCYRAKVLKAINLDAIRFKGYAFQIEMKFKSQKSGFQVKEIPIVFTDRTRGESKMNKGIIKEAFLGVLILRLSYLFSRRKYKKQDN